MNIATSVMAILQELIEQAGAAAVELEEQPKAAAQAIDRLVSEAAYEVIEASREDERERWAVAALAVQRQRGEA